jgi:Zn-dependent protease
MRDLLSWNLSLGRWAGIGVRLHVLMLLFFVYLLHAATQQDPWPAWYAAAVAGIVLASALIHELAHTATAIRTGGRVDQIVLWPFGGLSPPISPSDPRAELLITIAGPLANAMICAASLPALVMTNSADWQLLNPLAPPPHEPAYSWHGFLSLVFWLNWVVLLVNLLPATPLDAGRLARSLLASTFEYRTAARLACRLGQAAGVGLWVAAWVVHGTEYDFAWVPLVLLGGIVFFVGQHDLRQILERFPDDQGYDLSREFAWESGAASEVEPSPLRRWLEERREARIARQRQIEADEEARMDDILARLHERGLQGLSEEDRAILNRVSARYRNRARNST